MVLLEIDFNYLFLWGHFRLTAELHERLRGKLDDRDLEQGSVGNLGTAYRSLGRVAEAIRCYEQALAIAREVSDRSNEGIWLGNLANCYTDLGETRRAIELYEQALAIAREIGDRSGEGAWLGGLASCYRVLGETRRAIDFYEQALAIAREVSDRSSEGSWLAGLASCYADLGETRRAIELNEQGLAIAREVSDRSNEGSFLGNLANRYADLGETRRAIDFYEQALAIAREIGDRSGEGYQLHNLADTFTDEAHHSRAVETASAAVMISAEIQSPRLGSFSGGSLARAHLLAGGLAEARSAVEPARLFDVPENNFYVGALGGVIALRQGDRRAAEQMLAAAVTEASRILEANPANYQALDSKALALCGLVLCGGTARTAEAVEAYRAARQINRDAGVVKRVLQLFDALAVLDKDGALAEVRDVAAGEK
jgi:tetratricopeptide (TPR) repeat protein